MASYEFGGGMDYNVCPVLYGAHQYRGESVVNYEQCIVAMGDSGNGGDVSNIGIGIPQCFNVYSLGIGLYRSLYGLEIP